MAPGLPRAGPGSPTFRGDAVGHPWVSSAGGRAAVIPPLDPRDVGFGVLAGQSYHDGEAAGVPTCGLSRCVHCVWSPNGPPAQRYPKRADQPLKRCGTDVREGSLPGQEASGVPPKAQCFLVSLVSDAGVSGTGAST